MGQFTLCAQATGVRPEMQAHISRREETLAASTGFASRMAGYGRTLLANRVNQSVCPGAFAGVFGLEPSVAGSRLPQHAPSAGRLAELSRWQGGRMLSRLTKPD